MLKNLFSLAVIIAATLTSVSSGAAIYADDPNTVFLYHAEDVSVDGSLAYDDTTVTGRLANDLNLKAWGTVTQTASGYDGKGLDWINPSTGLYDGGRGAQCGRQWPNVRNQCEFKGWFWFAPGPGSLPIHTSAGGSSAAEMYLWSISTGNDSGRIVSMYCNTTGGSGGSSTPTNSSARIRWGYNNNTQSLWLQLYNPGLGIDRTGKWIRVRATVSSDGSSDPNYQRMMTLSIYDPSTGTTDSNSAAMIQNLNQAARDIRIGWMSSKTSTPYRGFRGKLDELVLRDRTDGTPQAYAPIPATGASVSPTSNMVLQWTKGLPRYPSQPVTQTLRAGTDPNLFSPGTLVFTPSGNTQDIGAVSMGQTWYWRVYTYDPGRNVTTPSAVFTFDVDDIAPTVNLGPDLIKWLTNGALSVSLAPTVTDPDTDPGSITYQWTQLAGPTATIVSPTSKNTVINFNATGSYFFELVADDGPKTGSDVIRIQVFATPCAASQASSGFAFKTTDYNRDCSQNFNDFASFAANWAKCNSLDPACL